MGKIVVAPERSGRLQNELDNNIYFSDWILIEPDLDAPYPVDMKNFDDRSSSVDTQ